MIKAHPLDGFTHLFGLYLRRLSARSFRGIWVRERVPLPAGGFIAAPNHTSWWDGFVPFMLQRRFAPRMPFYLMMSERELRRFPFFRWGGAFSVDAASARRARASVIYAAQCASRGAGVWIFPEGRIAPPGAPLPFTSGFVHAAVRAATPIVPVAIRYAFLEAQRPDVFVEAAQAIDPHETGAAARTHEIVAAMLSRIDDDIAKGCALDGRTSLLAARRGIDDAVSILTAPLGRRLQ